MALGRACYESKIRQLRFVVASLGFRLRPSGSPEGIQFSDAKREPTVYDGGSEKVTGPPALISM